MLIDPVRINRQLRAAARQSVLAGAYPLNAAFRRWTTSRGTADPAAAANRSALVIAPHPDDETIGVGALIARKRAVGTQVDVVIVTDGRHGQDSRYISPSELAELREAESRAACAMLGVEADRLHFLRYEEGTLWRVMDSVVAALAKHVAELDPEEVLVTSDLDWHPDHQATYTAALRAVAHAGRAPLLWAYPVWLWFNGPLQGPPWQSAGAQLRQAGSDIRQVLQLPRPTLVPTERFGFLKRAAFECYASQATNLTGEAGWTTLPPSFLDRFAAPAEVLFPLPQPVAAPSGMSRAPRHTAAGSPDTAPLAQWTGARVAPPALTGPLHDSFERPVAAGRVIGSQLTGGARRHGVDVEATIAIDRGEARFGALAQPGWGRQGLSYGPFRSRPGLALAVSLLHGHQNAHTDSQFPSRREMLSRLVREFPSGQLLPEQIQDNLLVGFTPADRVDGLHDARFAFAVRAAGPVNGELLARSGAGWPALRTATRELPLVLVVVLREDGAMYFAASTPAAPGLPAAPSLRPFAIGADVPVPASPAAAAATTPVRPDADAHTDTDADAYADADTTPVATSPDGRELLFAGVHQSVHGETGHRIDSRIASVQVLDVATWAMWPYGAPLADRFGGDAALAGSPAEAGGTWTVLEGSAERRGGTLVASDRGVTAVVAGATGAPLGLFHVRAETAPLLSNGAAVGLVWRASEDGRDAWRLVVRRDHAALGCITAGRYEVVATCRSHLPAAAALSVQVLDDGEELRAHVNGALLFGGPVVDPRHGDNLAAGLVCGPGSDVSIVSFEAHPRTIEAPAELGLSPLWAEQGTTIVCSEDFSGPPGDLASHLGGPHGGLRWQRCLGEGHVDRSGQGSARVRADRAHPNPGRTAYTTSWADRDFADLEITVTPPGTARSHGHSGRGGLIFWQDADNYTLVNVWVDDSPDHNGSAISLFVRSGGSEDQQRAVWVNIGRDVTWGKPSRLRASCDGDQLLVWLDGEAVLYRRISDIAPAATTLEIREVGLVVNREWGDDTGSELSNFVGRTRTL